jgi:hypothetical protein
LLITAAHKLDSSRLFKMVLYKAFCISFIVIAIWATYWEHMIFGFVTKIGEKYLPEWLQKPLFSCPICLCPWYGTVIYWMFFPGPIAEYIVTIVVAMGINTVFVKMMPDD